MTIKLYFGNIMVHISPSNKKLGISKNLHKKGCWKMSKMEFLAPLESQEIQEIKVVTVLRDTL